jgi:dienelactone hydrolase
MNFVSTKGSWEKVVKSDMEKVIQHYKQEGGIKKIGIFGFCWGGKICIEASDELSEDIRAAVLIHPAFVVTEDADRVKSPTLVIPTRDEADFVSSILRGVLIIE